MKALFIVLLLSNGGLISSLSHQLPPADTANMILTDKQNQQLLLKPKKCSQCSLIRLIRWELVWVEIVFTEAA